MATLFIFLLLGLLVYFALRKMYRDRKNGKHGCGGNCEGCASFEACCKKKH